MNENFVLSVVLLKSRSNSENLFHLAQIGSAPLLPKSFRNQKTDVEGVHR